MNIVLTTNISLRKKLRRLFTFKAPVRTIIEKEQASLPRGITRTVFEDNTYEYLFPIEPVAVKNTEQCVKMFGRKQPANFRVLTLAYGNHFKTN